ncbi:hypothetical protein A1O1_02064 [Capronia coronata CBS 617.96]|uniref:Uncharacterized protein n=1 Tax=Capronia coronata CBS 617.96 TaxID=1182541 RepID=W9YL86_9EURO|nr:uncharacterized protein A1O1_02064 [Capronia coronata CBS 617.96]EXJ93672.1 hypothetical protein A1O1_02064 [Capronia coronata CBS 617.96]
MSSFSSNGSTLDANTSSDSDVRMLLAAEDQEWSFVHLELVEEDDDDTFSSSSPSPFLSSSPVDIQLSTPTWPEVTSATTVAFSWDQPGNNEATDFHVDDSIAHGVRAQMANDLHREVRLTVAASESDDDDDDNDNDNNNNENENDDELPTEEWWENTLTGNYLVGPLSQFRSHGNWVRLPSAPSTSSTTTPSPRTGRRTIRRLLIDSDDELEGFVRSGGQTRPWLSLAPEPSSARRSGIPIVAEDEDGTEETAVPNDPGRPQTRDLGPCGQSSHWADLALLNRWRSAAVATR